MIKTSIVRPVVLCGGSGTRLWPLSRKSFPKQFVPLIGKKNLLQTTFERVSVLSSGERIWSVASKEHRFNVQAAADAAGVLCTTILEPEGRNTTAAMAVAALNARPDQLLLFLPADHLVPDGRLFSKTVGRGVEAAEGGAFVTFGIKPTSPHTGYGYICAEGLEDKTRAVRRFVEKPDYESAVSYLASGDYFWNSGIFLVRVDALLDALQKFAPDILVCAQMATQEQRFDGDFIHLEEISFSACRSEAIDYSVLEKHDNVVMVEFRGSWSDVGSWNEVADLAQPDVNENRIVGAGNFVGANSTYIHSTHRPVVAIGTSNLVIIETADAVLVANKNVTGQVKDAVKKLEKEGFSEATEHRFSSRPWGTYDVIDESDCFKVKRITVKPGAILSLQSHRHRAEHWVVVRGTARVTRGEEVFLLSENESTFIPLGVKHRLENPGLEPLEMIEVQSGSYLGEDDIERFDDSYGRD